jgi:putative SOS response-associated peptidase YedK
MLPTYRLDTPAPHIAAALRADQGGDLWPGGAVAPGGYAPVVITEKGKGRRLVPRQWGVPPPPRGEFVVPFLRNLDSPFWIGPLRHTQFRCLVPITHLRKGRDWLALASGQMVTCAGLWRDSEVPSFAIVTAGAAGAMPVVLAPGDIDLWLHADIKLARRLVEAQATTP